MEINQKRGWLKFALTTTLAVVFMLSMAVTAMANVTARLVPSEPGATADGDWHLALDLEVDIPDAFAASFIEMDVLYDPTQLTPFGAPLLVQRVDDAPMPAVTNQPIPVAEDGGLSRLRVRIESPGLGTFQNAYDGGRMARLRFAVADGVTIEQVSVSLRFTGVAAYFVDEAGTDARLEVVVDAPTGTFGVTNLLWSFYNVDGPSQAFITAVTTGPAADWFNNAFLPALNVLRAIPGFENADGPTIEANMIYWHNRANPS